MHNLLLDMPTRRLSARSSGTTPPEPLLQLRCSQRAHSSVSDAAGMPVSLAVMNSSTGSTPPTWNIGSLPRPEYIQEPHPVLRASIVQIMPAF
eukprot:2901216-Prymnesium_polylepis.2